MTQLPIELGYRIAKCFAKKSPEAADELLKFFKISLVKNF